jgi:hypothetical protein
MSIESAPATKLFAITPSDSTVINVRALWVGGAGNVAVIAMQDTAAQTLSAVPAGTLLPVSCSKVMSTNTTATLILGLG